MNTSYNYCETSVRSVNIDLMLLWRNIYTAAHLALDVKHSHTFLSIFKLAVKGLVLFILCEGKLFYSFIIHAYRRGSDMKQTDCVVVLSEN